MKIRELVRRDHLVYCYADEPIECAVAKMYASNVGSVVVVDRTGSPVGIITERDIVRLLAEEVDFKTPLERVARKNLVTASPDDTVIATAAKMIEKNIRHIPVVEGGRVIGVVSIRDVLRALVTAEAFP
ncbi:MULTISPECIES: CBS domain-containing protein [Pyrobaculum]|uniref:CBS domain-containing protein n=2 Tax=Pyrobaculum arsenaticum TaxID=121277 RepID=A0A7L4P9Z9_9CREN|nr:CBS domain-containing protein [Pyrobaculum arsenaticum]ABP49803.1 putative signal-transduction protein with CBS domains [Pyrobaculum arsenaticum DSM 13514]MCY0890762.1 CBS domain-containing protein [Pyrobaculum arsenaticum]NYR15789.1 CBS domain-containing protein [Pyrobaculum arsenaticum]